MNNSKGFTLIELMIVVAIIAILAGVAYPSYSNYITRSNRTEGMTLLNDAAARQERFFSQNNVYATTAAQLGLASANSAHNLYQLQILVPAPGQYTLTAVPINSQLAADTACRSLTLDQTGTRGVTGTTAVNDCWR